MVFFFWISTLSPRRSFASFTSRAAGVVGKMLDSPQSSAGDHHPTAYCLFIVDPSAPWSNGDVEKCSDGDAKMLVRDVSLAIQRLLVHIGTASARSVECDFRLLGKPSSPNWQQAGYSATNSYARNLSAAVDAFPSDGTDLPLTADIVSLAITEACEAKNWPSGASPDEKYIFLIAPVPTNFRSIRAFLKLEPTVSSSSGSDLAYASERTDFFVIQPAEIRAELSSHPLLSDALAALASSSINLNWIESNVRRSWPATGRHNRSLHDNDVALALRKALFEFLPQLKLTYLYSLLVDPAVAPFDHFAAHMRLSPAAVPSAASWTPATLISSSHKSIVNVHLSSHASVPALGGRNAVVARCVTKVAVLEHIGAFAPFRGATVEVLRPASRDDAVEKARFAGLMVGLASAGSVLVVDVYSQSAPRSKDGGMQSTLLYSSCVMPHTPYAGLVMRLTDRAGTLEKLAPVSTCPEKKILPSAAEALGKVLDEKAYSSRFLESFIGRTARRKNDEVFGASKSLPLDLADDWREVSGDGGPSSLAELVAQSGRAGSTALSLPRLQARCAAIERGICFVACGEQVTAAPMVKNASPAQTPLFDAGMAPVEKEAEIVAEASCQTVDNVDKARSPEREASDSDAKQVVNVRLPASGSPQEDDAPHGAVGDSAEEATILVSTEAKVGQESDRKSFLNNLKVAETAPVPIGPGDEQVACEGSGGAAVPQPATLVRQISECIEKVRLESDESTFDEGIEEVFSCLCQILRRAGSETKVELKEMKKARRSGSKLEPIYKQCEEEFAKPADGKDRTVEHMRVCVSSFLTLYVQYVLELCNIVQKYFPDTGADGPPATDVPKRRRSLSKITNAMRSTIIAVQHHCGTNFFEGMFSLFLKNVLAVDNAKRFWKLLLLEVRGELEEHVPLNDSPLPLRQARGSSALPKASATDAGRGQGSKVQSAAACADDGRSAPSLSRKFSGPGERAEREKRSTSKEVHGKKPRRKSSLEKRESSGARHSGMAVVPATRLKRELAARRGAAGLASTTGASMRKEQSRQAPLRLNTTGSTRPRSTPQLPPKRSDSLAVRLFDDSPDIIPLAHRRASSDLLDRRSMPTVSAVGPSPESGLFNRSEPPKRSQCHYLGMRAEPRILTSNIGALDLRTVEASEEREIETETFVPETPEVKRRAPREASLSGSKRKSPRFCAPQEASLGESNRKSPRLFGSNSRKPSRYRIDDE